MKVGDVKRSISAVEPGKRACTQLGN